jgi:nucleoside-diphosphate-sugar epimerase
MTNVLVLGGSGYLGSQLIPALLNEGYKVRVFDIMFFGNDFLPHDNPNLEVIQGDIRDADAVGKACEGMEHVISLGCISNDASFELDDNLSTSINLDAFEPMVKAAKAAGVRRFYYASSSSVYGVSDAPEVREDHPLVPLTHYNKYKGMCEPVLFKHQAPDFVCVAIRPATLMGFAPRQRLDLSVNILTAHAVVNNKITVFGGDQQRPNLHVLDFVELWKLLLTVPDEKIAGQIFNVGYMNQTISDIANRVKKIVEQEFPEKAPIEIVKTPTDDNRSYRINSDKIGEILGFKPSRSIEDAVKSLCDAFKAGKLEDAMVDDKYYNVRTLKKLQAK